MALSLEMKYDSKIRSMMREFAAIINRFLGGWD